MDLPGITSVPPKPGCHAKDRSYAVKKNEASRRDFIKISVAGAAVGTLGILGGQSAQADETGKNRIKIAGYDYDRVRTIMDGQVGIEGAEVSFDTENIYTVSRHAFGPDRKYEVTEIGLIPFIRKYINEDFRSYTLIPVFISRIFRHRNVFVHVDSGIEKPGDLRGKRVGTPGYGFSANTWIRGFLLDEYGVKADEMQWIETTESSDGARLSPKLNRYFLSDDFPLVKGPPGVDESELLLSGGCDALITAITPRAFLEGNPKIKQLFPDVRAAEQNYYRKTRIFPIMHAVAIRTDMIEANPWLPKAVFEMYSKAKLKAYANLETTTSLKVTLPWVTQEFEDTRSLMGKNFWPYGVEANRKELELVMRYTHEQGLVKHRLKFEELFHPSTLNLEENMG
ncbi:MAG: ABC transporter substrate-binding protein [Deltaproteobacteria bacterium]|nr:ABC transporter substrate-binding protein [Deltaproteobacteria bacterium]